MYIIFEQLNLIDLLSVAEVNNNMHLVAANVFRYRYHQKRFMFIVDYAKNDAKMHEESDFLAIYDESIVVSFMEKFGNLVSRMDMAMFPHKSESYAMLNRLVSAHSTESLVDLYFNEKFRLDQLTKPFKKVETVLYRTSYTYSHSYSRMEKSFNQMNTSFPALRCLIMDYPYLEKNYINCHLPHLENVYLTKTFDDYEDSPIKGLFADNPQIQSFRTDKTTQQFLETLQENLPNLQNLTLSERNIKNFTGHFDSVNKLTITETELFQNQLTFSNLQELQIEGSGMYFEGLVDFMDSNSNIKRFILSFIHGSNELFKRIALLLRNMVEVTLLPANVYGGNMPTISADTISNFIETHDKLMLFELGWCTESYKEIFRKRLSKYWDINKYEQCLSFKRKYDIDYE